MSSSPRQRRSESWLSRILSPAAPPSASPSPQRSDSESRYSHRSTAAEVPLTTELPTYAESAAQTDTESLERFIQRVEAARRLIRGSFDRVADPPIPKRVKVRANSHVYERPLLRIPAATELPTMPLPAIPQQSMYAEEILDPVSHDNYEEAKDEAVSAESAPQQEDAAPHFEEEQAHFQPPASIAQPSSPQRIPLAPAPSPQSSSASSPSIAFGKEKNLQGAHPPGVLHAQTSHSFFVEKPPAEESFFEDSGIIGGDDDSSDDPIEEVAPQSKSLFSSQSSSLFAPASNNAASIGTSLFGSAPSLFAQGASSGLFAAPKSTNSLFSGIPTQKPEEKPSLFAPGPPSGSIFSTKDIQSQGSSSIFSGKSENLGTPSLFAHQPAQTSIFASSAQANLPQGGSFLLSTQNPAGKSLFAAPVKDSQDVFTTPATILPSTVSVFAKKDPPPSQVPLPLFSAPVPQPGSSSVSLFGSGGSSGAKPVSSLFGTNAQQGSSLFGAGSATGNAVETEPLKEPEEPNTKAGLAKPLQPSSVTGQTQPLGDAEKKRSETQTVSAGEAGPKPSSLVFNNPIFVFNPSPFVPSQLSPFATQPSSFTPPPFASSQPSSFTSSQHSPFSPFAPSQPSPTNPSPFSSFTPSPFTPSEGQTVFQSSPSSSGFSLAPPTNTPTDPTPPTP